MIKCEGEVVTIKGSWKQILSEYMKLSEAIMIYSDKYITGNGEQSLNIKTMKAWWRRFIKSIIFIVKLS